MRVEDLKIRERHGEVRIRGKGNRERYVPLNATARRALQTYLDQREAGLHDPLFLADTGAALSVRAMQSLIMGLARRAHITRTRVSAHSFSWTRLSCGAVNQADEVESIGHGRELAADSVPGKKESAIEHGDENAIEAPRNYNEFSVNGNNPLNSPSRERRKRTRNRAEC